jgi:hypothetical protein
MPYGIFTAFVTLSASKLTSREPFFPYQTEFNPVSCTVHNVANIESIAGFSELEALRSLR